MQNQNIHVAIVEDNDDLREELSYFLSANGFIVWESQSAEQFWRQLHTEPTDIVLVDIGLPGEDGYGVVEHLSQLNRYGSIILTARGNQSDKLLGLQSGADLYLVKPINFSNLIEQIKFLWQRLLMNDTSAIETQVKGSDKSITKTNIQLNKANRHVSIAGQPSISLTPIEFAFIERLSGYPDQVLSKQELCDHLWRGSEVDLHRVDVVLSRLRVKFRTHGIKLPIYSVFGKGLVYNKSM